MTRNELEQLCQDQLGGGPYLLTEILPETKSLNIITHRNQWDGAFTPGYVSLRRWPGPGKGFLYVQGSTWDELATKLGIVVPEPAVHADT